MPNLSSIEIQVRSTEIDVNGHVNNAKYLEYLEWGREDWFEANGLDYDTLKSQGAVTVTAKVTANYRREAVQNDRLRVQTSLLSVGNSSFRMSQEITNQQGQLVLDAEFVIVTVDPATHTSVRVPDSIRGVLPSHGR
ncbi:acyl-CoA thioesterase [Alicyclobacillus sp. ALC3]|uniref:acyl-CoA thioesterase n=1 Tax=Alicyclobacillus sp. ALC3 TaxID=2796143 RepID=UPI002378B4DC|nr:thioesterase family protein [Alicyclobacillus sp. ALC3]WDL97380.1 acyl-CoA thioesterase [Alicyclobacillus sp. ALC3]